MNWRIGTGCLIIFTSLVVQTVGQYGSSCVLPNQQKGRCMPIKSCKSIHDTLLKIQENSEHNSEENQRLFDQIYCGTFKKTRHVCCADSDIQLNYEGLAILKNQSCGYSKADKVSNGDEAALFELPWMALLIYNDTTNRYQCGGSLISEQYVLTAAHCVKPKLNLYQVRLGEHRISTEVDCTAGGKICAPPVENVDIEEVIMFEGFKKYLDDIALIRLKRRVKYQRHIKPICLPIYDNLRGKKHEEYILSGWGQTHNESRADVLMKALIPFIEQPKCLQFLRQHGFRLPLTESLICAGNQNLTDSCIGDSGGPVGYMDSYNGRPRFVQFGLVSFGFKVCGLGDAPSAYTSVSHYLQWITDNLHY